MKANIENTESNLSSVTIGHWFMERLNYNERERIRVHYKLKNPTLKITNEMLLEIYNKEIQKPQNSRLLERRFYNYK